MTDHSITIRWETFEDHNGQTFMREFWSTSQGHTVYGPIPDYYDVAWWIEQRKALIQSMVDQNKQKVMGFVW